MKYRVTMNCVAVEDVEASSSEEAESIARECVRVGDADIVWASVERIGGEEEEAA